MKTLKSSKIAYVNLIFDFLLGILNNWNVRGSLCSTDIKMPKYCVLSKNILLKCESVYNFSIPHQQLLLFIHKRLMNSNLM